MIGGTREWAVAEVNCCLGCPHDCRYCYARAAALRRGIIERADQWRAMRMDPQAVGRQHPRYPGQVMFPSAHDIVAENLDDCLTVLENLLLQGNRVLVVSKPSVYCMERICRYFKPFREQLLFRFTVTACSEGILSLWEPGAPPYEERLAALKSTYGAGFATSVSIEPLLVRGDIDVLLEAFEPLVTHSIWIGSMNKIAERVTVVDEAVQHDAARIIEEQQHHRIMSLYRQLRDNPLIRWKESIKQVVGLPLNTAAGLDR